MENNTTEKVKNFIFSKLPWLFAVAFTVANLYLASLLTPLKEDIRVLASRLDSMQNETVQTKLNEQRLLELTQRNKEIRDALIRIEAKIDRVIERQL